MKRILGAVLCVVLLLALVPALPLTASAASLSNFNIRLDEPVASYTPDFSPEFNTDVQIYNTVTWQENSPGFNMKLNSHDEFQAGLAYKVEIWVRFGDGNYLATDRNGDLAAALTVNGKAISSLKIVDRNDQNQIVEVKITCEYDPLPGSTLNSAIITGIPSPVAGQMPIYSFSISSSSYFFWHTAPITWWDLTADREMDSGDTFVQGHIYQLNIWLCANRENGFTWKLDGNGKPDVNVTLNSWAADKVTVAYEQDPREVIDIRYNFPACPAAHTCAPQYVPQQDPSCEMYGFKAYYACSCGKCFEDAAGTKEITDMDGYGILPALGHKETAYLYDAYIHYKYCNTCGVELTVYRGQHTGGTATCQKQAVCTVCNQAYGEKADHKWSPTYLYMDATGHAWICADCKAHSKIEPHIPGPAGTPDAAVVCKDCGYIITPEKNHTHELTKVAQVAATCTQPGNIEYYTCSGCSDRFADQDGKNIISDITQIDIAPLGHTTSDDWSFDEAFHWRTCTTCHAVLEETKLAHDSSDGLCNTCGYDPNAPIQPEESEPEEKPTDSQKTPTESEEDEEENTERKNKKTSSDADLTWLWILLTAVVCFGIAGVVIFLIIKKNKKEASQ